MLRKTMLIAMAAMAITMTNTSTAAAHHTPVKPHHARWCEQHRAPGELRVKCTVKFVFGSRLYPTAIAIVKRETGNTYDTKAINGQYRGIFQMGSDERARFGHGRTALAQAKAAYDYYRISGWSPWGF